MLSEKQEQSIQRACYSIGTSSVGPWLRAILELQNEVDGLKELYGSLLSRIAEVRT